MSKSFERDAIEAFKRGQRVKLSIDTRKVTTKSIAGLSEIAAVAGMKPGPFVSHAEFYDRVNDIQRNARKNAEERYGIAY